MQEQFEQYGKVERVKKIKDYAFIHFEDRDSAVEAMRGLNGKEVGASNIEVCISCTCSKFMILIVLSLGLPRQTTIRQKEKGRNTARSWKTYDANDASAPRNRWVSWEDIPH